VHISIYLPISPYISRDLELGRELECGGAPGRVRARARFRVEGEGFRVRGRGSGRGRGRGRGRVRVRVRVRVQVIVREIERGGAPVGRGLPRPAARLGGRRVGAVRLGGRGGWVGTGWGREGL